MRIAIALALLALAGCQKFEACSRACRHLREIGCATPTETCERVCRGVEANDRRFAACVGRARTCDEANACDGG